MLRDLPSAPSGARDPRRGAIVGRLVRQKRLDHAIEALRLVAMRGNDVRVDIYGNGPKEKALERLVGSHDLERRVTFRGYDPRAKDAFETASFTVLSSRYEGQPMILLEAMGAGCIPIAYDVEYGPADIITDGVDGLLVPEGDIEALAAAIERVMTLDERHLAKMRRAAIRRSRAFTAQAVTRSWGRSLRRARARKSTTPSVRFSGARLVSCEIDVEGIHLEIDMRGEDLSASGMSARVTWLGRSRDAYGRVLGKLRRTLHGVRLSADIGADALQDLPPKAVLDIYVDLHGPGAPVRRRIASSGLAMPSAFAGVELYTTVAGHLSLRRMAGSQP
nr:glycosyltransferase [Brachybacterium halotolerans]